mgnify:CR=1 FL=1|tara:strand:+ start:23655 stop:24206 length:552 start_codon:yes stop_codon:yes gene_type:complete
MPKVQYTEAKGLHQVTGKGVSMEVLGSTLGEAARISTAAPTALANGFSGALASNTHYLNPTDGNAFTATLPVAAASKAGDVIIVDFDTVLGNGQLAKFGTAGADLALGSKLVHPAGTTLGISAVDRSVAGDDFLNIDGLTNYGANVGSRVMFRYTGSAWYADALVLPAGNGTASNSDTKFHTS